MKIAFFTRLLFIAVTINTIPVSSHAQTTVFTSGSRSRSKSMVDDEFQTVGAFKVKGNPYVLKGANVSDIFSNIGYATNLPLVYNAYSGQVGILQADRENVIDLSFDELDSFTVKIDNDNRFPGVTKFINPSKIEPSRKHYLQVLSAGKKYGLYKAYKVELRPAASDLAQTNLREFEIMPEYYFLDMSTKTEFKKLKNEKAFKKAFKDVVPDFTAFDNSTGKFEDKLITFFDLINK